MKLKSSPHLRGYLIGFVIFSIGAGCASSRPFIHFEQNIPPENFRGASRGLAESGNGGTRGGGDRVAGEFIEYERIVLAKMEAWHKQDKLKITDEDLIKIRALMPPNGTVNPKHIVTSEEHVCMSEGKLPNGECLQKEDERDIIKQPFSNPPRILVGRVRWEAPENIPLLKELIVQHELRGLALSKKGEDFADENFNETYRVLTSASQEWSALVRKHLDYIQKIRLYDEMMGLVDLSGFETVKNTFVLTSADYSRCVNAPDAEVKEIYSIETKMAKKIKRERRRDYFKSLRDIQKSIDALNSTDVKKACDRAIDQFQKALNEFATPQIQNQINQINAKIPPIIHDYAMWLKSINNPAWYNWLDRKMGRYLSNRERVSNHFNSYKRADIDAQIYSDLTPIMDERCARAANKDFRDAARCNIEAGVPITNAYFRSFMSKYIDGLIRESDLAIDEAASQVDPI